MLRKYDFRFSLMIAVSKKGKKRVSENVCMYVCMWMYVDEFSYN